MAEYVVDSAFAYLGALDVSESMDDWSMTGAGEALQKTTMRNSGAHRFRMGMITTNATLGGFTDMSVADPLLHTGFSARGTQVLTVGNDEAEGSPCCLMQVVKPTFQQHAGQVGQLPKYSIGVTSTDKYGGVRGVQLLKMTTLTTTGAKGTAVQHGLVGAGQRLFATYHLIGTAGTSITAVLESDNASNFATATTRITFGPLTAVGGTWATPVAGAIADDDWWRIRVTAISGTWVVAAAMAIE